MVILYPIICCMSHFKIEMGTDWSGACPKKIDLVKVVRNKALTEWLRSFWPISNSKDLTLSLTSVSGFQKTAVTLVVSPLTSGSISEMLNKYVSMLLNFFIQIFFQILACRLQNFVLGDDLRFMDVFADKIITNYGMNFAFSLYNSF